jgi:hypothetical protein
MKKFYLFSMALVSLMATANAQVSSGQCPNGDPIFIRNIEYVTTGGTRYCVIVMDNTWPDAEFTVLGRNTVTSTDVVVPSTVATPAGGWHTEHDSSLSYQYDCNTYLAVKIQVSKLGVGICETTIPAAAPLPIKLTAFTGRLQTESTVKLDFTSEIELNSYQYVIERSADGKTFTSVGTIKASGNSAQEIKYNFVDQLPAAGAYFYRLKLVDIDGSAEYSKVVYVNSKKGAGLVTKIFPNPFASEVQLIGATSADLIPANIKVFNMSGQQIGYHIVGANAISIDPAAPKGVYLLRFKGEQTFKLIKQ